MTTNHLSLAEGCDFFYHCTYFRKHEVDVGNLTHELDIERPGLYADEFNCIIKCLVIKNSNQKRRSRCKNLRLSQYF